MPHRHHHFKKQRSLSISLPISTTTTSTADSNTTTTTSTTTSTSLPNHHSHHHRKSVQFDLSHNTERILPRHSTNAWKKLEKQITDLGINTPATRAFGDYYVCERRGHPQVIVRSPPDEFAAKLMVQGIMSNNNNNNNNNTSSSSSSSRPDSGIGYEPLEPPYSQILSTNADLLTTITNDNHNHPFMTNTDDSDIDPHMFMMDSDDDNHNNNLNLPILINTIKLNPLILDHTLRKFSLSKVPHHSIIHYPKDNNMFVDWNQLQLMVQQTESLPDDLQDINFGIKNHINNTCASHI